MATNEDKTEDSATRVQAWAYSTDGESYRHAGSRKAAILVGGMMAGGHDYYVAPVVASQCLTIDHHKVETFRAVDGAVETT